VHYYKLFAALMLLVFIGSGCGDSKPEWTLEKRQEVSRTAGVAAASGYLIIEEPDRETAVAIKVVIEKIRDNLQAYQEDGFIGALPGISEGIAKALPGEENTGKRTAANNLAKILLEELDRLFKDHPDWKTLGSEVSGIIGSFLNGAFEAFDPYVK
jgi:hypothetical protein